MTAFRGGYVWCNMLCPVGAVLGMPARFSWFKPPLDSEQYVKCRADISEQSEPRFLPLEPRLETALDIAWKKSRLFSSAAEVFFKKIWERFGSGD